MNNFKVVFTGILYQRRDEKQELYGPEPDFIFDFFFPTEKKAAEIQKRLPAPQRGYRRSSFFYASILPQNGNQNLVEPLSRAMVCPVTKRDSSEAKKRTAGAMSVSGSPSLFIGW